MESAFGVEHGDEIAKFSAPSSLLKPVKSLGTAMGSGTASAGRKLTRAGAKTIKTNPGMGRAGLGGVQAGGALRRAGAAMKANPTATGLGALGVGGGAAGGVAYGQNKRRY